MKSTSSINVDVSKTMSNTSDFIRYVILLQKIKGKATSHETIKRHIDHLRALDQKGSLVLCGPFSDHDSGMVVVKAKSKDVATAIAEADPFVVEGVRTFEVRTWLLACAENEYMG